MNNHDVAALLDDIGDMLEIKGDNPFRVRAHHRAANSIRGMVDDINATAAEHKLTDLPGIGEGLAARIEELLATGKMAYYDELTEFVPPRVLELMRVPGLGPKKAKLLYDDLRITSVDELFQAAKDGRVRDLPGMSVKTEENIIAGIELLRSGQERMLLSEAFPLASAIRDTVRAFDGVDRADFAGSLRRMKETIGDIDIIASSGSPASVTRDFTRIASVDRVIAVGDTKASVLTSAGLQVDLRVVKPDEYGSALQYFTGSKEHNVALRDMAKKRGLKISEYGIFETADGKNLGSATEQDIYSAMGMDYIEPEMREDKGEIGAAERHALPSLVTLADIRGDLQSHSTFSDGLNHVEEMAVEAKRLGYEYIALTDHAEKLKIAGGMTRSDITKRKKEIDRVNNLIDGVVVLNGVELNIDSAGEVDYADDVLREFDVVLGSVHSGFGQPREKIMKRLRAAMENPHIHIIAHPTGRIIGKRNPYDVDIEALFALAADTGTILELNSFPNRLDLKDDYLREAKRLGLKISMGTDSHMAAHLSYMMYGVATARRGWLEAKDIINTYKLEDMLLLLKRKT